MMNTVSVVQAQGMEKTFLVPEPWSLDGSAFFDAEGHEIPMTQEMIVRACEDLLHRLDTRRRD